MEKIDIHASIHSVPDTSFIGKLRKLTDLLIDLPTEAQWEYACRAGTTSGFNNGTDCIGSNRDDNFVDINLDPIGWYGGNWNWAGEESSRSREGGARKPNDWGLYDMHGQLWEFCLDWYGEYLFNDKTDPIGAPRGNRRVTRGGSWHAWPALCRSANRHFERGRFLGQGFRIVCHSDSRINPVTQCIIIDVDPARSGPVLRLFENAPDDLVTNPAYKTNLLVLQRIKAGTFMMGSPSTEIGRDDDENQRETTISNDFFMGVFHVTQKQWENIMGENPSTNKNETYPVETVGWEEVRGGFWPVPHEAETLFESTFCGKLSSITGLIFDLPTEARWEYACRAGTMTAYNNGKDCQTNESGENVKDAHLEDLAFYDGNWSWEQESRNNSGRTVGQRQPNKWNLYDMHGMVWEYCKDWYGPYSGTEEKDPSGISTGIKKVCRGGNWHSWPAECRSANRQKARGAYGGQGIRIVCEHDHIPPDTEYLVVELPKCEKSRAKMRFVTGEIPDLAINTDYKTTHIVLKRIQAGSFMMGSPKDELGRYVDEVQHKVTLTRDYFMGVFPVTQKQWELIMCYNNSIVKYPMIPVDNMNWEECTI